MTAHETPEDLHAVRREQKRRKARYGMRVTGAGARTLARLIQRPGPSQRQSRPGTPNPGALKRSAMKRRSKVKDLRRRR